MIHAVNYKSGVSKVVVSHCDSSQTWVVQNDDFQRSPSVRRIDEACPGQVVDLDSMASLDEESSGPAAVGIQRSIAQLKKAPDAAISRSRSFNRSRKKAEVKKRARVAGGPSTKTQC